MKTKVRDWMTRNPITIDAGESIVKAIHVLKEKDVRRLPVLKDGKLVGLVTERMLLTFSPGKSTSMDSWQVHYLLSKTPVREAMNPKPNTVTPDTELADCAQVLHDRKLNGITVVDDYGHHPAEIKATLAGARASFPHRRIVCAFQPHRYSRTRDLLGEFATAFNDADALLLTEIYAAGEDAIAGVSGARLHEAVKSCGHRDAGFVERAELVRRLREKVQPGDLVITLGAGDITHVGDELLELLK